MSLESSDIRRRTNGVDANAFASDLDRTKATVLLQPVAVLKDLDLDRAFAELLRVGDAILKDIAPEPARYSPSGVVPKSTTVVCKRAEIAQAIGPIRGSDIYDAQNVQGLSSNACRPS